MFFAHLWLAVVGDDPGKFIKRFIFHVLTFFCFNEKFILLKSMNTPQALGLGGPFLGEKTWHEKTPIK